MPWFEFKDDDPEPEVVAADPPTVVAFGDHCVVGESIGGAERESEAIIPLKWILSHRSEP